MTPILHSIGLGIFATVLSLALLVFGKKLGTSGKNVVELSTKEFIACAAIGFSVFLLTL